MTPDDPILSPAYKALTDKLEMCVAIQSFKTTKPWAECSQILLFIYSFMKHTLQW